MASTVWNVPNVLSMIRLVFSVVLFVLIAVGAYLPAVGLFVITALTDFVDGWWARHFHQCTKLGRMLDPFADKILICGTFIFLAAEPRMLADWRLFQPWMAVVIMGREMLVTAIRGAMEGQGVNFGAKWPGKIKMGFQCVAAIAGLLFLAWDEKTVPPWLYWTLVVSLWVTILSTLQSGWGYIRAAIRHEREKEKNEA